MSRLARSVWVFSAFLIGCDSAPPATKAVPAAVETVQKAVANPAEAIKQITQPPPKASLDLELAGPIKTATCQAAIDALPGRPSVLRIASYADPAKETFPSVLIIGQVSAAHPAALVNQQVRAQVFVMRTADGAVLQTPPGQSATLTITGATDKSITGKFEANSMLQDSSNQSQLPLSGTFTATLP